MRVVKSIAAQGVDSEAAREKATAAFAARFRTVEEGKREKGKGKG